jgi:thioredoxin 1
MADMPQQAILHLDDASFQKTLEGATTPVLVDFYADWCGPCKMAAPVLEKLATEMKDSVVISKVNVDETNLAQQFGVMSIPTVIAFVKKDGKVVEVDRKIGFPGEEGYRQMIQGVVSAHGAKAA